MELSSPSLGNPPQKLWVESLCSQPGGGKDEREVLLTLPASWQPMPRSPLAAVPAASLLTLGRQQGSAMATGDRDHQAGGAPLFQLHGARAPRLLLLPAQAAPGALPPGVDLAIWRGHRWQGDPASPPPTSGARRLGEGGSEAPGRQLTCSHCQGEGVPTAHHGDSSGLEPLHQVRGPAGPAGDGAQLPMLVAADGVALTGGCRWKREECIVLWGLPAFFGGSLPPELDPGGSAKARQGRCRTTKTSILYFFQKLCW